MSRKLEIAANLAILLLATLSSVVLARNYLSRRPPARSGQGIAIGTPLPLTGVDWRGNGNTIVLAVSKDCHFCTESAPFYRRLASELESTRVHFMALVPEDVKEGSEYLKGLGLSVSDVRQGRSLRIRGTPTLMLVDEKGIVRHMWEGMVPAESEQQVIETLKATLSPTLRARS